MEFNTVLSLENKNDALSDEFGICPDSLLNERSRWRAGFLNEPNEVGMVQSGWNCINIVVLVLLCQLSNVLSVSFTLGALV